MRITIESVDGERVTFASALVRGMARFHAASDGEIVGRTFDVELDHERVSELARCEDAPSVVALPETGAFRVCGEVVSIVPLSDEEDDAVIAVAAGNATFDLVPEDLRGMRLALGDRVTFVVHGLSLWDENL
ncbi:MAG TPA: hypothetical protein VF824_18515 [Thermoanaerobaculia bacterium]|jgi:hypothetical protein